MMRVRTACILAAVLVVAAAPARAQHPPPDGGVAQTQAPAKKAKPVSPAKAPADLLKKVPAKAAVRTGGRSAAVSQDDAVQDKAVIEHIDLLLLLDFLSEYDLFDETGAGEADAPDGGATFPTPTGSKGYRP